jgi:hypothetical protein
LQTSVPLSCTVTCQPGGTTEAPPASSMIAGPVLQDGIGLGRDHNGVILGITNYMK